jgi:predicted nucleic acid-binding protein
VKAALLDTNVLLALARPNHQHHAQAHAWFAAGSKMGRPKGSIPAIVEFLSIQRGDGLPAESNRRIKS